MSSSTKNAKFVRIEEAQEKVREAFSGLPGVRDVHIEDQVDDGHRWQLYASFRVSSFNIPLLNLIKVKRGVWVTGDARARIGDGFIVTSDWPPAHYSHFEADGDEDSRFGTAYTIWSIIHCEYLWFGRDFNQAVEYIEKMGK